jgi:Protein of unknown function (DUF2867)
VSRTISVTERSPPAQSRLADWYSKADLLDSFAVHVPVGLDRGIRDMAEAVLGRPELWVKALLFVRDWAVSLLGLQTSANLRDASRAGDHIDLFPVLFADDTELVVGEDDRHLDFRISLFVQEVADGGRQLVATTAVRCHNRVGHAYLAAIRPFHRLVIRSRLRRAAESDFTAPPSPVGSGA